MKLLNQKWKSKSADSRDKTAILLYAAAFAVPVIIMLTILYTGGFFPFGEKSMFIMDMKGQYLEFFASLRNTLSGDDSLFFSWSRSMGGNYLGLFAYYAASPLSFITLFFSIRNLTAAIVLLTLLKLGLCGLSFAVYGNYIWKKEHPHTGFCVLIFAISYALISYNMVYSLCPMWLDGVILLPAILLGVEKILDGKKGLHYMLMLAALFISNYYTGYMAGIFTALYFLFRLLSRFQKADTAQTASSRTSVGTWKQCGICVLRFTITTFLAFGLSAPLILPVVRDLMQGKLASQAYVPDIETNYETFTDLFGKLTNGVYDSITNAGLPSVYCGYAALALAILFFFLRTVRIREKIGALLILLLLSLSFYYTKWDIAWHGFQYPTWFPYRYAFVFSFFLLFMALRAGSCLAAIAAKSKRFSLSKWCHSKAACIVLTGILTVFVSVDMQTNGAALIAGLDNEFGYGTVEEYEQFIDKTEPLITDIQKQDSGFYRINQGFEYSKNDAMLLGYNGMTHYSSTFHAAVNTLTPKLGIAQSHIWNSGYGSNPLLDSLFSCRYILDDMPVPAFYTQMNTNGQGASSYQNSHALSIAYSAPVTSLTPQLDQPDPFVNQNNFLNTIAGTENAYFTEYAYTTEQPDHTWTYTFTADSSNPVYLYMKSDSISWADVYVNNAWVGNYFSTETSCTLYLGTFTAGQSVSVTVVPSQAITVNYAMIAQLHTNSLAQTLTALQEGEMKVTDHKNGTLSGTITVHEGEKILTSIPYDTGWTVKIDGKKAAYQKFADTFLSIDADPGQHEIEFSYVSPGFRAGMIVFVITLAAAFFYFRRRT